MIRLVFCILVFSTSLWANPMREKVVSKNTYLSLAELNKELKWAGVWSPLNKSYQWNLGNGTQGVLRAEVNEVLIDGIFYPLNQKVLFLEDEIWVPQIPLFRILDSLELLRTEYVNGNLYRHALKDIQGVVYDPRSNGTLVTVKMSKPVEFEKIFSPPYFLLRFPKLNVDGKDLDTVFTKGQIRNLKTFAEDGSFQMTWEINHLVGEIEVLQRKEGQSDLQILFRKPVDKPNVETKIPEALKTGLKTIIIDPGHGGKDVGALGLKTNEKTIVLKVAKELKKQLEKKGFTVKLTRDDDTFITLKERPKFASDNQGDLFISLHCNAIDGNKKRKEEVEGFKIYILREAKSEEDKTLARRENKFIEGASEGHGKSDLSPVEWISLEHQLNLYTKESEAYTNHLVSALNKEGTKVKRHGTGAGQAGFYVLVGAFMPAVLVEMGFISNPDDEKYMSSSKGQKLIASRIAESVEAYKKELEAR